MHLFSLDVVVRRVSCARIYFFYVAPARRSHTYSISDVYHDDGINQIRKLHLNTNVFGSRWTSVERGAGGLCKVRTNFLSPFFGLTNQRNFVEILHPFSIGVRVGARAEDYFFLFSTYFFIQS